MISTDLPFLLQVLIAEDSFLNVLDPPPPRHADEPWGGSQVLKILRRFRVLPLDDAEQIGKRLVAELIEGSLLADNLRAGFEREVDFVKFTQRPNEPLGKMVFEPSGLDPEPLLASEDFRGSGLCEKLPEAGVFGDEAIDLEVDYEITDLFRSRSRHELAKTLPSWIRGWRTR
jgi:hypothetical protein